MLPEKHLGDIGIRYLFGVLQDNAVSLNNDDFLWLPFIIGD
jgi:hypothetical protein